EVLRNIVVIESTIKISLTVYAFNVYNIYNINAPVSGKILIGRSDSADITILSKLVSNPHLELNFFNGECSFFDTRSSNGTYLNDQKVLAGIIKKGDVLKFAFCQLITNEQGITLITDDIVRFQFNNQEQNYLNIQNIDSSYPLKLYRSPRLKRLLSKEVIEVQAPPSIGTAPVISWMNVFLAPALSVVAMLGICLYVTNSMVMLYYSLPMSLIGVIMSITRYNAQKLGYNRLITLRFTKYQDYLVEQVDYIKQHLESQREFLISTYPTVTECIMLALRHDTALWNRDPYDDDFMTLSIGLGTISSDIQVKVPRNVLSLTEDVLLRHAQQMEYKFETNKDCPILMQLSKYRNCGIIGDRTKCIQLAKNLIVQAASLHSYLDLKIVVICDTNEENEWNFVKWLPHTFDKNRIRRYFASKKQESKLILNELQDEIVQYSKEASKMPHYMFVFASIEFCINHPIFNMLTKPNLKIESLLLFNEIHMLPADCHYIANFSNRKAIFYTKTDATDIQEFVLDNTAKYESFARSLAPLRLETSEDVLKLPDGVTYLEGYGVQKACELPIDELWDKGRPEKSMSVPVGISPNGQWFEFDIHEKKCGPHGLVAGMTGSGKSEMVQSWILSMATYFSPSSVNFILIDFKGTGLILPFKNIPHLAGTISNIDKNIGRNLIALEKELSRRQQVFNEAGVQNITQYLTAYRENKVSDPLPYLFIIIDEFAEFKMQFPNFMRVIDSVFGIGRTLGVHIILLTQKPGNVVSDKMNSNTRFRWCLKVASSGDSNDMIKRPDAAKITRPGRAYVKVGEDEIFEQTQSFWSGAPYNPNRSLKAKPKSKVSLIDNVGQRITVIPPKKPKSAMEKTEIDAVVEYLREYTIENNLPFATPVWTEKMPYLMYLIDFIENPFNVETGWIERGGKLKAIIGMIDNPREQSQYPLSLDFTEKGHAIIYGSPGSGKTTLMQTTIFSLALSYSPKVVQMYIMDFGGGSLGMYKQLPHVGGVALGDEAEKISKLSEILLQMLKERKKLFVAESVLSITSYTEATGESLPEIILFIDNFAPILGTYPYLADTFQLLTREGSSYGMYVVITGSTTNSVSYRISQSITQNMSLIMLDKNDYTMIVGRTELEPENTVGRGLIKAKPPLEFQIALPIEAETESKRATLIKEIVSQMNNKWQGERPKPIPTMPDIVILDDYPTNNIFMGLTYSDYEPIEIDIKTKQFLTVSTKKKEPKLFNLLYSQIAKKVDYKEYLVYGDNTINIEGMIDKSEEFDQCIANWMPLLQARKIAFDKEGKITEEQFPFMLLAIYDIEKCFNDATDQTMKRLYTIANLGGGLNIIVLLQGCISFISKIFNGGDLFTSNMVNKRCALIRGGMASEHNIFKHNIDYGETKQEILDEDAYIVLENKTAKIRLVEK
ncbi:type VII secretion protein EssC, partial [Candidatus Epulonipiscioides gigas]